MIGTARALIKIDRTGSWDNHLHAVLHALPIFPAGHYNYIQSAYLYIHEMSELESKTLLYIGSYKMASINQISFGQASVAT
jgi:hypothetical protein